MVIDFKISIICYLLFLMRPALTASSHSLVLIVSYDAFRFDYINKGVTPTLARLRDEGCTADYLENVFITKTFPNHASIATGLYPEVHGVLGNSLFDPVSKKELNYSYELWHYNDHVIPIWIENERQGKGRHSGVMMWPGNEFNYSGVLPTFHQEFSRKIPWKNRVDTAVSWFQDPTTPANLVMLYIEEPDAHGHAFGPDSEQALTTLHTMESITKYIIQELEKFNLKEKVNVFFLSDHGMQTVTKKDILDLRNFVDESSYSIYETSPTLHIYPKAGKGKYVYDGFKRAVKSLGGFNVYKPQEQLHRWHYSNNRRTPPILLVADPPHVFHDFYRTIKYHEADFHFTANDSSTFGVHGYDNQVESMRPYFIANGPAIRGRTRVPPFRTIDLFSIWAELLGFPEAGASTNGSSTPAHQVLKTRPYSSPASIATGVMGAALVLVSMAITVYFVHRRLQYKYHRLLQADIPAHDSSRERLLNSEDEEA